MSKRLPKFPALLTLLVLVFQPITALASNQSEIDDIISQAEAPFGVVFEIAEVSDSALEWAIPQVNNYIVQLRKKFPELNIAIVSHGSEQFSLLNSEAKDNAEVHKSVQSLVSNDVPVHVCATHASWRDKYVDDFPDFVDVTPSGPSKVRDYLFIGYTLIEVDDVE